MKFHKKQWIPLENTPQMRYYSTYGYIDLKRNEVAPWISFPSLSSHNLWDSLIRTCNYNLRYWNYIGNIHSNNNFDNAVYFNRYLIGSRFTIFSGKNKMYKIQIGNKYEHRPLERNIRNIISKSMFYHGWEPIWSRGPCLNHCIVTNTRWCTW